jgi:hypothetical protein
MTEVSETRTAIGLCRHLIETGVQFAR